MTDTLYKKVEIPSKYDIIPIHTSDVGNFLYCRRYWNWASPARSNLRHKVEFYGIDTNLWFGSGIHYALESYYNPTLKRDPVEAFQTWYQYQWEGGLVTEDWLDRVYDVKPELYNHGINDGFTEQMYLIKGLRELLPDPRFEEFEELLNLGIGMMTYYKEWSPKHDFFDVIAAEALYSIPLVKEDGSLLTSIDTREESPNFGKRLEVHARGKRDSIIYDGENNQYGLIDYKTASLVNEDYFLKLENDAQVSNYMWASQQEAKLFDLPYKVMSFCEYQAMWKAYPSGVKVLADGISPSISRTDQTADADMFAAYIRDSGLQAWYDNNPKAQAFYEWLIAEGEKRYVNRKRAYRSQHALETTGRELAMMAEEMLSRPNIYKRPSGDRRCTRCAFRVPCLAMDNGDDWLTMINDGYERNRDR